MPVEVVQHLLQVAPRSVEVVQHLLQVALRPVEVALQPVEVVQRLLSITLHPIEVVLEYVDVILDGYHVTSSASGAASSPIGASRLTSVVVHIRDGSQGRHPPDTGGECVFVRLLGKE